MKSPDHDEIYTEDSVSFSCHINVSSGWEFQWYKDASRLAESASNHTMASVVTGNSGSYQCKVKRGSGAVLTDSLSVELHVNGVSVCIFNPFLFSVYVRASCHYLRHHWLSPERPAARVDLLTGWSEVFSTDSLVLQCDVESQQEWNYTWSLTA